MPLRRLEKKVKTVEYKVRAVTRYIVTCYERDPESGAGSIITFGDFDNIDYANRVRQALEKADPAQDTKGMPLEVLPQVCSDMPQN